MAIVTSLVCLLIVLILYAQDVSLISQHPKLLVVSYDAFRYDYFNRHQTPFMNQLRENGTRADYMRNVFVTKTFPNHHTMATGLFVETHGVVGNKVFDPRTNQVISYSQELYNFDDRILPIWTVNEKAGNGRHSGSMMWPGANFAYQGVSTTFHQSFNSSMPWRTRVDTMISWFTHPTMPINFGMLYIEEPDLHGHAIGINTPVFNNLLSDLDNVTEYLYDRLRMENLADVNVIHLSDHGMKTITMERIINLSQLVNASNFEVVDSSPCRHIFPKPGKFETVYKELVAAAKNNTHFTVYKKEDIPKKYHYGNNPRIGSIFVVADLGYAFEDLYSNIKYYEYAYNFTANNESEFGLHGWDNETPEMRPMFFAYGPTFRTKYTIDPFNNTDLYPLFCEILQLSCPRTNGTLEHVKQCLKFYDRLPEWQLNTIFIGLVVLVGAAIGMIIYIIKRRKNRTSQYSIVSDGGDTDLEETGYNYDLA